MATLARFFRVFLLCLITTHVGSRALPQKRNVRSRSIPVANPERRHNYGEKISPKVFVLNAFAPEAASFYGVESLNLLAQNITIPGLSPLYPAAHCSPSGEVCQVTMGESEINAASSVAALVYSNVFDLTSTYFLIAGIAGINPLVGSTGSVTFARFETQVALQYEFDIRDLSSNFSSGYIPFGTKEPLEYPKGIYGTEVFEFNDALRQKAIGFAQTAALNDTVTASSFRSKYPAPANAAPFVIACDGATSDVYFTGRILSEAFDNYTKVLTNGTGEYCATAQEDSAVAEVMLRAANASMVDFGRIIAMRTASDFDRPPPDSSAYQFFFYEQQGAFPIAIANLALAGTPIIEGIVSGWEETYKAGITPTNYIGDIFGTLGGVPDFGPYPYFGQS